MKENRQTTGRFYRIVTFVAVLAAALGLVGCGKTIVYKGGTQYPYEIKEKAGGTLQISLNGSKTPDYLWECEVAPKTYEQVDIDGNPVDPLIIEPPVLLKQKGKGKGGKGKYVVKPTSVSDSYQLVFTLRRKDTTEPETVYNAAGLAEDADYDDFSARLYLDISVDTNEKGKLLCHVKDTDLRELTGAVYMAQDTPYGYSYMVSEDGSLTIKLPALCDYEMSMEAADLPEEIKKEQQARIDQEASFATETTGTTEKTDENAEAPEDGRNVQTMVVDEGMYITIESPAQEDYSGYDEETAAQLRAYDEEIRKYYEENARQIAQDAMKEYYASYGMVDDETALTEGRSWDQNPNLAIWKTSQATSADRSYERFTFTGMSQGSVILTAKSALAGLTIRFVIDSDEEGRISVRQADYEGGQTKNEKAFTSYVYENGEDETADQQETDEEAEEEEDGVVSENTADGE